MKYPPGYHQRIPFGDYAKIPAVNNSVLKGKTAKCMKTILEESAAEEGSAKESLIKGALYHAAILEPDLFEESIHVSAFAGCTGKGFKEEVIANPGKIVAPEKWIEQALDASKSVWAHPNAAKLLEPAARELTGVFQLPIDDEDEKKKLPPLQGKIRTDLAAGDWIADVKTTASFWNFESQILKFSYHMQAAWYLDGDKAITGKDTRRFFFIIVQPEPPYHCQVSELAGTAIEIGAELYQHRLEIFRTARREKQWPGLENKKIHLIDLPDWYYKQMEENRSSDTLV